MKSLMPLALALAVSCAEPTGSFDELTEFPFAIQESLTRPTQYTVANTEALNICGGGVMLYNQPAYYYMGRAFNGWGITAEAKYEAKETKRSYLFGYVEGTVQACLWMGPPTSSGRPGQDFDAVYVKKEGDAKDRCERKFDFLYDRDSFGTDFNCPPHDVDGGSRAVLTKDTDFFYNLQWQGNFAGGNPKDQKPGLRLRRGEEVAYRYRTKDKNSNWAVVEVKGYGWGFIDGASVQNPKRCDAAAIVHYGCQPPTTPPVTPPTPPVTPPDMTTQGPTPPPTGSCKAHCIRCNKTNLSDGPVVDLGNITEQACKSSAPRACTLSWATWGGDSNVILEPQTYCGIRCNNDANTGWNYRTERACRNSYSYCQDQGKTARIKWGADYLYNVAGCP